MRRPNVKITEIRAATIDLAPRPLDQASGASPGDRWVRQPPGPLPGPQTGRLAEPLEADRLRGHRRRRHLGPGPHDPRRAGRADHQRPLRPGPRRARTARPPRSCGTCCGASPRPTAAPVWRATPSAPSTPRSGTSRASSTAGRSTSYWAARRRSASPATPATPIISYGTEHSLAWFLELGFKAVKVFLRHGPESGLEGLRRDEELVARAREQVGPDVELMVDAWMSLDVEYAVRLAEALRPYRVKWLEDALLPEDLDGYARLRQRLPGVTLASGEHWYTIHPFAQAASQGLVDILQPDALWCGGITASVRICHLAEAYGLTVVGHAGMNYPYGQHLALAMPAIHWGERSEGVAPPGVPLEEMVALPGTVPIKDGYVRPTDAPGFGIEVTKEWLEERAGVSGEAVSIASPITRC